MSGLGETDEAFVVTAVLSQGNDEMAMATVTWPKQSFDSWWRTESAKPNDPFEDSLESFVLPIIRSPGCVADTWDTVPGVPSARYVHTVVWTGTEMIVWGGSVYVGGVYLNLNTGGRYDPSTDTCRPRRGRTSPPDALTTPPSGRAPR